MKIISKLIKNIHFIQAIKYIFFGFLTTMLNILLFIFFLNINMNYKLSNLISIIISVLFAYFVNKIFVFKNKCYTFIDLFKNIIKFFLSRAFTSIFDYFALIIFVDNFCLNKSFSKIIIQIIVIILNYILSKYLVYKN